MAQMAAHLVERVIPWVPTRQWVVSVPIPLRYWMAASQALTAKVHTIIRTTIGQYDVNQAVKHGLARATVHPGSVTFLQRFGSALNLNLHFHGVFMEGVSLEAAIGAARLTRVAYDVFVSPLVTLAATVADDFLSITLAALTKARSWLQQINADNATLAALQAVLKNWVDQVHTMPKKLQTITETDLDGAQAYLRALQRKIQEEQAKLNGQSTTKTPGSTSTPKHP